MESKTHASVGMLLLEDYLGRDEVADKQLLAAQVGVVQAVDGLLRALRVLKLHEAVAAAVPPGIGRHLGREHPAIRLEGLVQHPVGHLLRVQILQQIRMIG